MARFSQEKKGLSKGVMIFIGLILLTGAILGILAAAGIKWWEAGSGTAGGNGSISPGTTFNWPSGSPPSTTQRAGQTTRPGTTVMPHKSVPAGCTVNNCVDWTSPCQNQDATPCNDNSDCCVGIGPSGEGSCRTPSLNLDPSYNDACEAAMGGNKYCHEASSCVAALALSDTIAAGQAGLITPDQMVAKAAGLNCSDDPSKCCGSDACAGQGSCISLPQDYVDSLFVQAFPDDCGAGECAGNVAAGDYCVEDR
jgi:hypothetical protein